MNKYMFLDLSRLKLIREGDVVLSYLDMYFDYTKFEMWADRNNYQEKFKRRVVSKKKKWKMKKRRG